MTGYMSPYMQAGATAANGLTAASQPFTASMMSQYSPAYQFKLQQGQTAANRQAAAMGVTGSGGTAKALSQYAQDYAGTAFGNAANIYDQNFQRLATTAQMGQQAATTAGQTGVQAAEYGGTLGTQTAQYAGSMGTEAAQYAGTADMQGTQYAGNANIAQGNLAASNTLSGANYLANTQIGAQQAIAQGDLGAASQWNNMLGGIGNAANTVAMAGFGAGGGWSPANIGTNFASSGFGMRSPSSNWSATGLPSNLGNPYEG
jgi:hypothetical protein